MYFFNNPTKKLRVRELERETNTPLPSVIRYTKEITEEKILQITELSSIKLFSLIRTSKEAIFEKKQNNKKKLKESRLESHLKMEINKSTILFVFWPVFGVAPKVTYRQYAPFGAP